MSTLLVRCRAVVSGKGALATIPNACFLPRSVGGTSRGEWLAGGIKMLRRVQAFPACSGRSEAKQGETNSWSAAREPVGMKTAVRQTMFTSPLLNAGALMRMEQGGRGMASKAKKKAGWKGTVPISTLLEKGVERVIFTCPKPNRFRMLGGGAVAYSVFSLYASYQQYFYPVPGLSYFGYVIYVGIAMSSIMLYVVHTHARRHVARLAVKPGLIDEIVITTHTIFGGEISKTVLCHQISPAPPGEKDVLSTPWKRFKIQGDNFFYLLDDSGELHDEELARFILDGKPIPRAYKE